MVERLRGAGWNVATEDVSFPFFKLRSARLSVDGRELERGEDFRPIVYSGSGRVAGRAVSVGNGCGVPTFALSRTARSRSPCAATASSE